MGTTPTKLEPKCTKPTSVLKLPTDDSDPQQQQTQPEDDTTRLAELFKRLDHDGDGRINVHDLAIALRRRGIDKPETQATEILAEGDADDSGDITLEEFISYAKRTERKLKLVFTEIDRNRDGKLDLNEILQVAKEQLGIGFRNEEEVKEMIRRLVAMWC